MGERNVLCPGCDFIVAVRNGSRAKCPHCGAAMLLRQPPTPDFQRRGLGR